ncbi:MAG: hypothetical protein AB7N76_13000 [Planctomycetota bacterium]
MIGDALSCDEARAQLTVLLGADEGLLGADEAPQGGDEGALGGDGAHEALAEHLEGCADCAAAGGVPARLAEAVREAAAEPLAADDRERLLAAGRARVSEDWAGGAKQGWLRWGLALAAALLLALGGLGGLRALQRAARRSACERGECASQVLAAAATRAEGAEELAPEVAQRAFSEALRGRCCKSGIEVCGCRRLQLEGQPDCAVLALRCSRSGQRGTLLHLARGCLHGERTVAKGREYVRGATRDGRPMVGWRDDSGVWLCVAEREVREGALLVLASAIRGG